ncbi:hypothetical protein KR51_00022450 [Rubidibacter lacunae KORDI 51-2]|uniref:Uncharacterized protein n=1 Tax=Rubidibacter lacunae KORDI 51-2 TaxID=582515 RepID=U5DJV2_9CHRO|nr:hypothetical protein KR51_00022450 [Rubidibacter lacunae KORDI 51-2]
MPRRLARGYGSKGCDSAADAAWFGVNGGTISVGNLGVVVVWRTGWNERDIEPRVLEMFAWRLLVGDSVWFDKCALKLTSYSDSVRSILFTSLMRLTCVRKITTGAHPMCSALLLLRSRRVV